MLTFFVKIRQIAIAAIDFCLGYGTIQRGYRNGIDSKGGNAHICYLSDTWIVSAKPASLPTGRRLARFIQKSISVFLIPPYTLKESMSQAGMRCPSVRSAAPTGKASLTTCGFLADQVLTMHVLRSAIQRPPHQLAIIPTADHEGLCGRESVLHILRDESAGRRCPFHDVATQSDLKCAQLHGRRRLRRAKPAIRFLADVELEAQVRRPAAAQPVKLETTDSKLDGSWPRSIRSTLLLPRDPCLS